MIAATVFQTGDFTRDTARYVWAILAGASVGLLAITLARLYSSAFYSMRDTRTPLMTNTGQLLGRILLIVILLRPLGVLAIPAAFAVTSSLETLALGAVLWRKLSRRIAESGTETEAKP